MRKAERLFHILNVLRSRRTAITAEQIADTLEISKRTVYRDIQSLLLSGIPLEGGSGVGYLLQRNIDLPPLMFDKTELEALVLGARMVRAWSDKELAIAAHSALTKILSALPDALKQHDNSTAMFVPTFGISDDVSAWSEAIRKAIAGRCVVEFAYQREDGETSQRRAQPLGLFFWGKAWTLLAWCELRTDYRSFRLDRIADLVETTDTFQCHKTKCLEHFLALQKSRSESL